MFITPVIFVSRDNQEVDTAFPKEKGTINYSAIKGSTSSRFFKGSQGKNIIKLTHEVNFDSEEAVRITLEVIDPERSFEEFFLSPIQNDPATVEALMEGNKVTVTADRFEEEDNIFIAYGFGDRRENWSAPHTVKFVDLKIDVGSEGVRTFTLGFVPALGPMVTMANVPYQEQVRCTGSYSFDDFREFKTFDSPAQRARGQVSKIDFSQIIQSCVEGFLKQAVRTRNVITLLPEVEKTHSNKISQIKNIREEYEGFEVYNNVGFNLTAFKKTIFGENAESYYRDAEGRVRNFLVENFGIQVAFRSDNNSSLRGEYLNAYGSVAGITSFQADSANISNLVAVLEGEVEQGEGGERILYEKVFSKIAEGYAKGDTYSPKLVIRYETDLEILALWEKFGYIEDKRSPTVIYGDLDMINLFLYGRFSYEELENIPVKKYVREADLLKFSKADNMRQLSRITKINFGPFNQLPDDLALKNIKDLTEKYNLPVFTQGFRNSDILKLSVDLDKAYFAALQTGIQVKKAIANARALFDQEDIFEELSKTKEEVKEKFEEWVGASYSDKDVESFRRVINNFVFKNLTVKNKDTRERKDEIVEIILKLVAEARKEDELKESLFVDDSRTTEQLRLQTLEAAYNIGYRASIRTLPRFKSSSGGVIGIPSYLLARHPYIYGVNTEDKAADAFYSGLYSIAGFKHTIGVDDGAYSEFSLYKSPQAGGVDIFRELDFNESLQRTGN